MASQLELVFLEEPGTPQCVDCDHQCSFSEVNNPNSPASFPWVPFKGFENKEKKILPSGTS